MTDALMWSSVVGDLGDRLIPDGGKGLFGKETYCRQCGGRGYTRKNESVWQACPHCYAGRCWTLPLPPQPDERVATQTRILELQRAVEELLAAPSTLPPKEAP